MAGGVPWGCLALGPHDNTTLLPMSDDAGPPPASILSRAVMGPWHGRGGYGEREQFSVAMSPSGGSGLRVELYGPFKPGAVSKGQMTYPAYEEGAPRQMRDRLVRTSWARAGSSLEASRQAIEHNHEVENLKAAHPEPWNKGKPIGSKSPLRPSGAWSIRTTLQMADRKRDLALFNLG